jgi:hypothetical protein
MKTISVTLIGLLLVAISSGQEAQPQARVFLQSTSHGNVWAARRDQSMEMAKDFAKNCPEVKVTILQNAADYTVILNHIEVGAFGRDNQFQVANKEGDMLGGVREKGGIKSGSINGGVKAACNVIVTDWQARLAAAPASAAEPVSDPVSTPAPTPSVSPAVYQPQAGAQAEPATQSASQPLSGDDSLGEAARKAKQHKACLDLAKDNPSIVCK